MISPTRSFDVAALQRWNVVQAIGWPAALLGVVLCGGLTRVAWLVIGALAVVSYAWLLGLLRAGHTLADRVTLARCLGLVALCGMAAGLQRISVLLWLGFVAVLLADLADGWAARRFGGSQAGAVLDMETDQLATLGLALVAWGVGGVPGWVLALPACRWLSVVLQTLRGGSAHDPKPRDGDNRQARALCALMLALLVASLWPAASHDLRAIAAGLAVAVLAWSHGSDLVYLVRRQAAARPR